jgi:hypothetical protein
VSLLFRLRAVDYAGPGGSALVLRRVKDGSSVLEDLSGLIGAELVKRVGGAMGGYSCNGHTRGLAYYRGLYSSGFCIISSKSVARHQDDALRGIGY